MSVQLQLRQCVGRLIELNPDWSKLNIAKHFKAEGVAKSTIYGIIQRYDRGETMDRRPGSGKKPVIMTKRRLTSIKKLFDGSDSISQTRAASKFNCTQQYISTTLKNKTNIKTYKKIRSPEYTESQIALVKTQCRRLNRNSVGKEFVIDNEHYFTLSKSQVRGNDRFYTSDKGNMSPSKKYYFKHKFEAKVLLWIAVSPRGVSAPYFLPSKNAVNQEVYREECLRRILVPFIREKYPENDYVFWPDKASSHYAKSVTSFLQAEHINFVMKKDNPTNLPQARPIEDFFGYLDQMVYKDGWRAADMKQLRRRVKSCLKKVDLDVVRRSMETLARLLLLLQLQQLFGTEDLVWRRRVPSVSPDVYASLTQRG